MKNNIKLLLLLAAFGLQTMNSYSLEMMEESEYSGMSEEQLTEEQTTAEEEARAAEDEYQDELNNPEATAESLDTAKQAAADAQARVNDITKAFEKAVNGTANTTGTEVSSDLFDIPTNQTSSEKLLETAKATAQATITEATAARANAQTYAEKDAFNDKIDAAQATLTELQGMTAEEYTETISAEDYAEAIKDLSYDELEDQVKEIDTTKADNFKKLAALEEQLDALDDAAALTEENAKKITDAAQDLSNNPTQAQSDASIKTVQETKGNFFEKIKQFFEELFSGKLFTDGGMLSKSLKATPSTAPLAIQAQSLEATSSTSSEVQESMQDKLNAKLAEINDLTTAQIKVINSTGTMTKAQALELLDLVAGYSEEQLANAKTSDSLSKASIQELLTDSKTSIADKINEAYELLKANTSEPVTVGSGWGTF